MNEIGLIASSGCLPVKPAVSEMRPAADNTLIVGSLAAGICSTVAAAVFSGGAFSAAAHMITVMAAFTPAGIPVLVIGCVLLGLWLLHKLDILGNLSQLYDGLYAWYKNQQQKTQEEQTEKSLKVFTNALVMKNFEVKDELSIYQLIRWIGSFSQVALQMYQQNKEPKILNLVEQMAQLFTRLSHAKNGETVSHILDEECFENLLAMLCHNAQFLDLFAAVANTASSEKSVEFRPFAVLQNETAPAKKAPTHHPAYRNEIHQLNTIFNNHYDPALVVLGAAAFAHVADPATKKFVKAISSLLP